MCLTNLNRPHWMLQDVDPAKLLVTHIVGALFHGGSTYAMIDLNQYPHDSNLTLNCLLHSLALQARAGKLTPTVYIQLDNCARENKNKYFLGCMALLVKLGFTKEITLSFLMVGHTHEGKQDN